MSKLAKSLTAAEIKRGVAKLDALSAEHSRLCAEHGRTCAATRGTTDDIRFERNFKASERVFKRADRASAAYAKYRATVPAEVLDAILKREAQS